MDPDVLAAIVGYVETSQKVIALLLERKGDIAGHEFHGNRFTGGLGGEMNPSLGHPFHANSLAVREGAQAHIGYMMEQDHASIALDMLKKTGGFTYDPAEHHFTNIGDHGFAVSPYKGREAVFTSPITSEDLRDYIGKNADVLGLPGHNVGGWDDENGHQVLDVSIVVPDKGAAVSLAHQYNQDAIFDFAHGQSIATKSAPGEKGDAVGHGFHGNRYTGGIGGSGNLPFNVHGDQYFHALSPKGQAFVQASCAKFGVTPDAIANEVKTRLSLPDGSPNKTLLDEGAKWYPMAHELADKIATSTLSMEHPVSTEQVAAAMAKLSPQTAWETNAEVASRLSQWYASGKGDGMSSDKAALAFKAEWQKNGWGGESITHPGNMNKLAMMNNLVSSALDVLSGAKTIEESLTSPKQRSFANNIMLPHETGDVTVDVMMQKSISYVSGLPKDPAAADESGQPRDKTVLNFFSAQSVEAAAGPGYVTVAAGTRIAAEALGYAPDTVQAAYWIAVQDETPPNWPKATGATMTQMKTPNVIALLGHPFIGTAGYASKAAHSEGAPGWPLTVDYGTMPLDKTETMSESDYDDAVDEGKSAPTGERKYSEDEERDDSGRWASGGGGGRLDFAQVEKELSSRAGANRFVSNIAALASLPADMGRQGWMMPDGKVWQAGNHEAIIYASPTMKNVYERAASQWRAGNTVEAAMMEQGLVRIGGASSRSLALEIDRINTKQVEGIELYAMTLDKDAPCYIDMHAGDRTFSLTPKAGDVAMGLGRAIRDQIASVYGGRDEATGAPNDKTLGEYIDKLPSSLKSAPEGERKYSEDEPRDNHGEWTTGGGGGTGPIRVSSIDEAVTLLGQGKGIMFERPDQAVTLLHELSRIAQEAKAAGTKAPTYDLCKVSVANTNLFCSENVGIPRSAMPQLIGKPIPGSPADSLPKSAKGEVDLGPAFRDYLTSQGSMIIDTDEFASHLRASQTEMDGTKVGGMMESMQAGTMPPGRIFISDDNYVIDGHHRWAATVGEGLGEQKEMSISVARINMKILPALAAANSFAQSMGIPQSPVSKAFFGSLDLKLFGIVETKSVDDEARDGHGRWTAGGGDSAHEMTVAQWQEATEFAAADMTEDERRDAFYVYDAEENGDVSRFDAGKDFKTEAEMQTYAAELVEKYAPAAGINLRLSVEDVGMFAGNTDLERESNSFHVEIGKGWMMQQVVCHEVAHAIAAEDAGVLGHGASFRDAYLRVLKGEMPKFYASMSKALKAAPAPTTKAASKRLVAIARVTSLTDAIDCFGPAK